MREADLDDQLPLLLLDIDGVISLFGFPPEHPPAGSFHAIEGIPHFLSGAAPEQLQRLAQHYELTWASGWEDRANEHLPHLLRLPGPLPFLSFDRGKGAGSSMRAHWKLSAVDAYADQRALAWVDDAFDRSCELWASERAAPTLLLHTQPHIGLTNDHTSQLIDWAAARR